MGMNICAVVFKYTNDKQVLVSLMSSCADGVITSLKGNPLGSGGATLYSHGVLHELRNTRGDARPMVSLRSGDNKLQLGVVLWVFAAAFWNLDCDWRQLLMWTLAVVAFCWSRVCGLIAAWAQSWLGELSIVTLNRPACVPGRNIRLMSLALREQILLVTEAPASHTTSST